jgi:nucleoid DNA-binding protein
MTRIGKTALIEKLQTDGITLLHAEYVVNRLSEIMTEELSKGNSISFHRVCTIRPKIVEEKVMPVAGKDTKVPQHLNLNITTSKHLKLYYKKEISEKGKMKKGVRAVGDLFYKK